jgi:hypothetical protein
MLRDKDSVVVIMSSSARTPCRIFVARSETVYGQVCVTPVTSSNMDLPKVTKAERKATSDRQHGNNSLPSRHVVRMGIERGSCFFQ